MALVQIVPVNRVQRVERDDGRRRVPDNEFEKRHRLMKDWAEYCASPRRAGDRENVVRLREHA
jgi:hypothetical protein